MSVHLSLVLSQHMAMVNVAELVVVSGVVEVRVVVRDAANQAVEEMAEEEEADKTKTPATTGVKVKAPEATPDTRLPDMQICLLLSPVSGTGPMGSPLISAWSRGPVHGSNT